MPLQSNDLPAIQVSQRFCAIDSDVTVQSSDGVLFNLHRTNLQISFGSWELCMNFQGDEIVQLPESSTTLDLLFRFCYPERHPDLDGLEFGVVAGLAEATEKYKLYSAINVCKIRMRDTFPQHALDILIYAAKHHHDDIIDMAAPLVVLRSRLSDLLHSLPPDQRIHWVSYHDVWQNVVRDAISYYDTWASSYHSTPAALLASHMPCTLCGQPMNVERDANRLLRRLGAGLEALQDLDATFSFCCHSPEGLFTSWRKSVEGNIKRTPAFSSLCRPTSSMTHSTATRRHVFIVSSPLTFLIPVSLARQFSADNCIIRPKSFQSL
ncbi:hypothetical protein L208DRAFT_229663 [Tricholoma matsutake]|nr:hypothetical protein L208DRAFT_229663 [Tricholoma matsutake 945]